MFSWQRRMRRSLLILLALDYVNAFDLWPFKPKRFSGTALVGAGSLGLSDNEQILAFGDFNGDQFADIVSLDSSGRRLTIYLWNHDDYSYHNSASLVHSSQVDNVVPGDFTHDGTLDLLVMSHGSSSTEVKLDLYVGSPENGLESPPISLPSSSASQPIPLDANGDLKIDLLGSTPGSSGLNLWTNSYNKSNPNSPLYTLSPAPLNGNSCRIANPHSNAVLDFDGDCLADIFLVCDEGSGAKSFQIWLNRKTGGFTLGLQGALPQGTQAISFADMNRDGTIDIVFTTCSSVSSDGIGANCYVNIAYNLQLPLCSSTTSSSISKGKKTCRPPDQLCYADPNFRFDFNQRPDNNGFLRFPITDINPQASLLVLDTRSSPPVPLPIRLGDANLDGYPDLLLVTVADPHGGFLGIGSTADQTPQLLLSTPCSRGIIACSKRGPGIGWSPVKKGAEPLSDVVDAVNAAFIDVDEDGTLDIVVQRSGKQGAGTVLFVQNNFFFDAFFLKAIVLNGACDNGWCTGPNGTSHYQPFGVSYSGASFKYTILDTTGRRSAAQVAQLPQTAYQSLLPPYAFFGLGRTNNYIENLFVGSTGYSSSSSEETHFTSMEGVIPNSKVVIYPPASADGSWHRELYLRPGDWIPWVTLTVVVTVILLAIIVFILHLNEKREDELERRRASHHINFDAL